MVSLLTKAEAWRVLLR